MERKPKFFFRVKLPDRVGGFYIKNTSIDYMANGIVLIEDNIPFRDAFEEIISATSDFYVINSYTNCETAIEACIADKPDIVLMDVELPGINGVEGTKRLKKKLPNTSVIMVTVYENSEIVFDALCAGATGYLTKNLKPQELIEALEECVKGGAPMSINIAKMVVGSFQKNRLKSNCQNEKRKCLRYSPEAIVMTLLPKLYL